MFTKLLLKSAATTAAVGGLFAASLVATPAVVATAPEVRTVACDIYAPEAPTQTTLDLARLGGPYGALNRATATVTSGDAVPTGSVRFVVRDLTGGHRVDATTVALADGSATLRLSRYLRANRAYQVAATFLPADPCEFAVSEVDVAPVYFITKRLTSTLVDAPARRARQRPVVDFTVGARHFEENLTGKARVVITKKGSGRALRAATVRATDGSVPFNRLRPGLYTAKVRYLGSANYAASSGADDFRIRR